MKPNRDGKEVKKSRSIPLPVVAGGAAPPKKRNMGRLRAGVLIGLNLLMIAHFVQWRMNGSTVSPIEPSEAMQTLQTGAVNAGFIFFILAIAATLILGRFVCGWACHIVALQDLCAWLLKKVGLVPRPFRSRLLVYVPLTVALYMFVWPTALRYLTKPPSAPLFPAFTNHIVTTDFWATFPPFWVAVPFLFVCGFLIVYFLGSKGFCTYACPYGGFFGVADKYAPGRIRVTDACNGCGQCTVVCTSNVIVHAEVKRHGMVVDPGCMKCMDCVSACPSDALYFGFGKPAISVKVPKTATPQLTWPEEIFAAAVFGLSFFAIWDVYQLVPMLMALGVAAVTTFLAVRLLKLVRSSDLSFYKWNLKLGGAMRRAGWFFAAFAAAWIGLNAHSGYVRYHEAAGNRAFDRVSVPDELALAQADPTKWLSPADREQVAKGREHYDKAFATALFTNAFSLPKAAWLKFLGGDTESAVRMLGDAAETQDGQATAISLYYRGAILNRLGRPEEAIFDLDAALAERPNFGGASVERGESLWRMGRREEAVATWSLLTGKFPMADHFLAGAAATAGNAVSAAELETAADRVTPRDGLYSWMLGTRLRNLGMNALAAKQFERAMSSGVAPTSKRNAGTEPAPAVNPLK